MVCATSNISDQPAHMRSLIRDFACRLNILWLTGQHLEFLSLKGGCKGSSESTLVKMPHCWKARVAAHLNELTYLFMDYSFHDQIKRRCVTEGVNAQACYYVSFFSHKAKDGFS